MSRRFSKKDIDIFRDLLLKKRSSLTGTLSHMHREVQDGSSHGRSGELSKIPSHLADQATGNFEQDFTLGLIENGEELVWEIDEALNRLRLGTFGVCEECGKEIPKLRLRAIPHARFCVSCKQKHEGNYF